MSALITGAHAIIYSADPEADILFFKNVLKFPNVDLGHGWLIFRLPPSEMAVHPSADGRIQELYLMCADIHLFVEEMAKHKIIHTTVEEQRWGLLIYLTLPGGGKLGVYEPKHQSPAP
jgi:hypothetical protein